VDLRPDHASTLRKDADDASFDAAVRYIQEHGRMETYWGKPYRTLYHGDHEYWTMGAPREVTILINRKHLLAEVP
jgi:hypothetical protein